MPINTDREISANRIVIKNNQDKKCTLTDVGIPSDKNTYFYLFTLKNNHCL